MRIGEFAKLANVTPKTLRYYDEIGIFKPVSIDPDSGYRNYEKEQINILKWIIVLKMLDFSLDEIKSYLLFSPNEAKMLLALGEKRIHFTNQINANLVKSIQVDKLIKHIKTEGLNMQKPIDLHTLNELDLNSLKAQIPTMEQNYHQSNEIIKQTPQGKSFAMIRIDIDRFINYNEQNGFEVGDKIILSVYYKLKEIMDQSKLEYTLSRLGGDEFAVLFEDNRSRIDALIKEINLGMEQINVNTLGADQPVKVSMYGVLVSKTFEEHQRQIFDFALKGLFEAKKQSHAGLNNYVVKELK